MSVPQESSPRVRKLALQSQTWSCGRRQGLDKELLCDPAEALDHELSAPNAGAGSGTTDSESNLSKGGAPILPAGPGSPLPRLASRLVWPEAASSRGISTRNSGDLLATIRLCRRASYEGSPAAPSAVVSCAHAETSFGMRGARYEMAHSATELARAGTCTWNVARKGCGDVWPWAMGFAWPEMRRPLDGLRPLSPAPGQLSETTHHEYTRRGAT